MTGTQLKALRTYLGLTQKEFAESIGTQKTRICEWEKEKRPIGAAYKRLIELTYKKELKAIS